MYFIVENKLQSDFFNCKHSLSQKVLGLLKTFAYLFRSHYKSTFLKTSYIFTICYFHYYSRVSFIYQRTFLISCPKVKYLENRYPEKCWSILLHSSKQLIILIIITNQFEIRCSCNKILRKYFVLEYKIKNTFNKIASFNKILTIKYKNNMLFCNDFKKCRCTLFSKSKILFEI